MAAERILLIEDEPDARAALARLLAEEGYTVCAVAAGRVGIDRLRDFRPDTIICDVQLPDIDGLAVLRAVRSQGPENVSFIVLTGACGGEEAEAALRREADHFFSKPVDLPEFRRALRHLPLHQGKGRWQAHHAFTSKGASNGRL